MKIRITIFICIIGILLMSTGCSNLFGQRSANPGTDVQDNKGTPNNSGTQNGNNTGDNKTPGDAGNNVPNTPAVRPASLGGVCLGDSSADVVKILGKDYTESVEADQSGYIGEDMLVWNYSKGIIVTLGKTSNKVINIVSHAPDFKTDLGAKTGDTAKQIFDKYRPKYKEVKSRHSNEILPGWFDIGNEIIMIFRFDANGSNISGSDVPQDSKVQEIMLAYWKHFD